jgi:hypothetical protein
MRERQKKAVEVDRPPGAFMADGSWNPKAQLHHRGQIHGLVRALCRQRREGTLSLDLATRAIAAANAGDAFPSVAQWRHVADSDNPHWAMAYCATAAEEAVKREGRGVTEKHWCGQRWVDGLEKDCDQPGHRMEKDPKRVAALVAAILAEIGRRRAPEPPEVDMGEGV